MRSMTDIIMWWLNVVLLLVCGMHEHGIAPRLTSYTTLIMIPIRRVVGTIRIWCAVRAGIQNSSEASAVQAKSNIKPTTEIAQL